MKCTQVNESPHNSPVDSFACFIVTNLQAQECVCMQSKSVPADSVFSIIGMLTFHPIPEPGLKPVHASDLLSCIVPRLYHPEVR